MKTHVILIFFLVSQCSLLVAQNFKKGNVVEISTYSYTLNPDVTIDILKKFYINKYIPEFEKNFPGIKEYFLIGERGDKKNQFAVIDIFESVEVRDKYNPVEDGTVLSEDVSERMSKMESLNKEAEKFFSEIKRTYTDWIVQN